MAGVTNTGFELETKAEISDRLKARWRAKISDKLLLDASTPEGQIIDIVADELATIWEEVLAAYNAGDPRKALGDALEGLALISGTQRRAASAGTVLATVTLAASRTFAAGDLVAHVENAPDNTWENASTVTTSAAGDYAVTFVSQNTGASAVALAGSLNTIAQSATGWSAITNAADAAPGRDQETIEELRQRREQELAAGGAGSLASIKAEVSSVAGVYEVAGDENTSETTVDGLPPRQFRIVIWDDGAAVANDIAQAIYDVRSAGARSYGGASGVATDPDTGDSYTEYFHRATEDSIVVAANIVSAAGVARTDVKAAIMTALGTLDDEDAPTEAWGGIGEDVSYFRLAAAPFAVAGVDTVSSFTINSGTSDISIAARTVAHLTAADITLSGDVT